ncbi:hypothetical protein EDD18DRAFT_1356151 [Armillaria luteobubalina]|uniref:Uncharacterized protein n=1 Tax=Armillaria luteobubalina TaxID=153913 RepID=A0AA39UUQ9_9AGAR|nr:hypothetical protein EDD18DRAFT_1356151 [Armillaria luteobubalina]
MATIYLPTMKRIRRCFFFSLFFAIVVPVICIILGVELHPSEFEYSSAAGSDGVNRTISLHADLISADLKQGAVVLEWSIVNDTCYDVDFNCTNANIYFSANLLQQSNIYMNSSNPSNNNPPADPTFIWNITADQYEPYSDIPIFQTVAAIFNPFNDGSSSNKGHPISHSHTSNVYYPFDHYTAAVFCFAEDATTNGPVNLHLNSTSGLIQYVISGYSLLHIKIGSRGLKITPEPFFDSSDFDGGNIAEFILVDIFLQRSTLVIWYCLVITITFCQCDFMPRKVDLMNFSLNQGLSPSLCLLMIMTVGFGFQQRNEIVVVPAAIVFAFIQLRSTMPGAPDGFGDILDFLGVLPCLVLLSICAVTMVGIYLFTDPDEGSREKLTWPGLVQALRHGRKANGLKWSIRGFGLPP